MRPQDLLAQAQAGLTREFGPDPSPYVLSSTGMSPPPLSVPGVQSPVHRQALGPLLPGPSSPQYVPFFARRRSRRHKTPRAEPPQAEPPQARHEGYAQGFLGVARPAPRPLCVRHAQGFLGAARPASRPGAVNYISRQAVRRPRTEQGSQRAAGWVRRSRRPGLGPAQQRDWGSHKRRGSRLTTGCRLGAARCPRTPGPSVQGNSGQVGAGHGGLPRARGGGSGRNRGAGQWRAPCLGSAAGTASRISPLGRPSYPVCPSAGHRAGPVVCSAGLTAADAGVPTSEPRTPWGWT